MHNKDVKVGVDLAESQIFSNQVPRVQCGRMGQFTVRIVSAQ